MEKSITLNPLMQMENLFNPDFIIVQNTQAQFTGTVEVKK